MVSETTVRVAVGKVTALKLKLASFRSQSKLDTSAHWLWDFRKRGWNVMADGKSRTPEI
jgi:hypothetical protein